MGLARRKAAAPRRSAAYFRGASAGRLHADWAMRQLSADAAIRDEIAVLRDRARELVINSAAAARIPAVFEENIVGKDGVTLQAKIESTRGNANAVVNARIEEAWYRWAERETASTDGRRSWLDTEAMAVRLDVVDGEFILRHVRGADNPFGYSTEVIDPDQLDHTLNVEAKPGQNEIRMGVEQDRWGRPVAYHLLKAHPSDVRGMRRDHDRVPADEIIHYYVSWRPRQSRGVSRLAPVIVDLKMVAGYREAVLVSSRAAASAPVMYETDPEHYEVDPEQPAEIPQDIPPGVYGIELPPGVKPHFSDPDLPNAGFDAFEKAILRSVATGVGISYSAISGDLTATTYGSGRMGMLAERAFFQKEQQRLIECIHRRVYREWLRMAMLTGALKLDSFDSARYHAVEWHPRPFPWIDPAADAEAEDKQLALGVTTHTRIANEQGRDFRQLVDERADEIEYARSKGVPLFVAGQDITGTVKPPAPQPGAPGKGGDDEEEQDEKEGKDEGEDDKSARLLRAVR